MRLVEEAHVAQLARKKIGNTISAAKIWRLARTTCKRAPSMHAVRPPQHFARFAQLAALGSDEFNKCRAIITREVPTASDPRGSNIVSIGYNHANPLRPVDLVKKTHIVHAEVDALQRCYPEHRAGST